VAQKIQYKPTRIHHTRAYIKKKMATAEQENVQLRADVSNLKAELEKMALMMETLMAEREQAVVSEPIPTVVVLLHLMVIRSQYPLP
jgi:SMC interacting uncharacterized protein involved in chromosome segregation